MKKLISIFAALAMVGALAAQKRKAPAKAPAKPAAVAAPAVPAAVTAPAPVVAAPAASGKGLGLSIEARGSWIQSHGTSDSKADGTQSATNANFALSNSNGFGGGLSVGYNIAKNLGLVASFDYRAISTRKWDAKNTSVSTSMTVPVASLGGGNYSVTVPGTADNVKIDQTTNTMVLGLGLRPSLEIWGGNVYAGMGFAFVLPYENKTSVTLTNATFLTQNGNLTRSITSEWNSGYGVYAELGYNYSITDMIFVGVGVRGLVATSNNDGKKETTVTTTTGTLTGSGSKTVEYAQSYDPSATLPANTSKAAYQSQGITDMTVSVTVGYRL